MAPGDRYNRLTIVRHYCTVKDDNWRKYWLCKCDCGNEHVATTEHLRYGRTKSCGCLRREMAKEKHLKGGTSNER